MSTYNRLAAIDPGVIFAEVPGVLGFYPTESFVIIGLDIGDKSVAVSPVLRADLDVDTLSTTAARMIDHLDIRDYIVIVSTTDTQLDMYLDMQAFNLDPIAVFSTKAVETGSVYQLHSAATPTLTRAWATGRVAAVHSARMTRETFKRGDVLEIDRVSAAEKFSHNLDAVPLIALEYAQQTANELLSRLANAPSGEPTNRIYREYSNGWRTTDSEDLMAYTLTACSGGSTIRDLYMADVADDPSNYRQSLLDVARTTDGEVRANALCIYALVANDSEAMLALSEAHKADADHNLTNLLLRMRQVKPLSVSDLQNAFENVRDSVA